MNKPSRLRLVTDAASEPVSLSEAKAYCRLDAADEDTLIASLIKAARRRVEKETGLALMPQTWVAVYDGWPVAGEPRGEWWDGVREGPISTIVPSGIFDIAKRPVSAVTAIRTRDAYGALATVTASIYHTEISDLRARVMLKLGQVWPSTTLAPKGGVEIEFTAGFADAASVPDDLKTAVLMLAKHWFDNREPASDGTIQKLPNHVDSILAGWRPMRLR